MRLLLSTLVGTALAAKLLTINPMKHSVAPVTRSDFDAVISKFRDRQVSVVFYYKPSDEASAKYFEPFNTVAEELRGMFKFCAVNCDDQAKLCKDEGVSSSSDEFPVIKVYPMVPLSPEVMPREDYDKIGDEKGGFKKGLFKLLSSEHAEKLTSEAFDQFMAAKDDNLPVVALLTSKKALPPLFKVLSTQFSKEMHFGYLPSPSSDILKKFKIKSESALPKIVLQQAGKKPILYDGELTYAAIHEWINVRRETFARGGGFDHSQKSTEGGPTPKAPARPWLSEDVPEMFGKSHKDICFKHDEGLCVVYLVEGEIGADALTMLKDMKEAVAEESIKFRFSWMNVDAEPAFKEMFKPDSLPNVVVFNPHKRLRYAGPLEDGVDKTSIRGLISTIVDGNGRFKMVPDKVLPAFADRKKNEKDEL